MEQLNYENQIGLGLNKYIAKIFMVVALGLFLSGASAYALTNFFPKVLEFPFVWIIAGVLQFVLVLTISFAINKLSKLTTWIMFIVYAIITGFTLSTILLSFDFKTISISFAITSVVFLSMAYIGHTTKMDLTRYSSYFMIALISLVLLGFINIFFIKSTGLDSALLYFGTLLFLGFVAYDIQYIKKIYYDAMYDEELKDKLIILGALTLYLDFINLFIRIIQIISDNK